MVKKKVYIFDYFFHQNVQIVECIVHVVVLRRKLLDSKLAVYHVFYFHFISSDDFTPRKFKGGICCGLPSCHHVWR